jgi:hypothetical protein
MIGAIASDTLSNLTPDRVEISLEARMNQGTRFRGPIAR